MFLIKIEIIHSVILKTKFLFCNEPSFDDASANEWKDFAEIFVCEANLFPKEKAPLVQRPSMLPFHLDSSEDE